MTYKHLTAIAALAAILLGCATLQPGADPFVVRVEQSQAMANATFDFVLHMDQSNRPFWATNVPAFHQFCSWLRTPTEYGTNKLARCVVMELNVADLKASYKAAKSTGSSNALFTAWSVLNAAVTQSASWSNIISSPIHP